jgi:prephenate dehydrogenase
VLELDAATHDRAVAGISHLPLVAAAALVEAVVGDGVSGRADWPIAAGLAASGWRDMTRLARGDPVMGAAIATTNAAALASRVRDLRDALDAWLVELEAVGGPDEAAVAARLARARAALDRPA